MNNAVAEDSTNYLAHLSVLDTKALKLLGSGLAPIVVASAIGVNESYISQLVSKPEFALEVAKLRMATTTGYIEVDGKYDSIEAKLLDKLDNCIGLMFKPMEILRAIQVINAAKRRTGLGAGTDTANNVSQVVNLTLPTVIIQKFTTNINNQVISAGAQSLITATSNQVLVMKEASTREADNAIIQDRVGRLLDKKSKDMKESRNEITTQGVST